VRDYEFKLQQKLLTEVQKNREEGIRRVVSEQFPDAEQAWAIYHLIKLRILPLIDGSKGGSKKMSPELARAKYAVVLNIPFRRPQRFRSGIKSLDGLTEREGQLLLEVNMKHDKFLDSNHAKASRAYASEQEKAEAGGRHSILCNELEWEILTRWRKEVSVAHKSRELKVFVDKLNTKTSLPNLVTTIHRLGLSKKITK
jgi:hypothetical protein